LIILLLIVLHFLPVLTGLLVIFYALLFDRKSLMVDYALLLSFFFGLAENMKIVLAAEISHSEHVFIFLLLPVKLLVMSPRHYYSQNLLLTGKHYSGEQTSAGSVV